MNLVKILTALLSLSLIALLAACGGATGNPAPAPAAGGSTSSNTTTGNVTVSGSASDSGASASVSVGGVTVGGSASDSGASGNVSTGNVNVSGSASDSGASGNVSTGGSAAGSAAGATAAENEIPLPSNISNVVKAPGVITFDAAGAAASIATFYKTEMPARGWGQGDSVEVEYGGVYELTFTKDGREVSISITTAGAKTMVVITFL